ncbi:MAG: sugar phosphate isomerase/epimerase, partial [Defluviitaleaceae bacterium]|nr:sugar phosphate isomerase/epimerase [Defluviitaleaceae bacterium]
MELNVDAHLYCMGTFAERYVPNGYRDALCLEERLGIMAGAEGLTGLNIFYPLKELPSDPVKLKEKLDGYGLRVSNVGVENFGDRRWMSGAFSTNDAAVRKETVRYAKAAIDLAAETDADSVLLWPAHDGFDYPFQINYADSWKHMVDTFREIGEYNPRVKLAIEAQKSDPRQRSLVSDTGKLMMLLQELDMPHYGGALDIGHVLQAQENLSEALAVMNAKNKLMQIHLNENYRTGDPDMLFGTVHFWEVLEFFYNLIQTDYKGWVSLDIIVARDNRRVSMEAG